MNRQPERWKERQEVAVAASMTPEARLAQGLDIMAKACALLAQRDAEDEDVTDVEHEKAEE